MLQIINLSDDPYFNMAVEDYLVHNPDLNEDIFMLWQNRPTVVVGRHQNSHAEINLALVRQKGIEVVRRLSGGGAVYHDRGNLNFTFITTAAGMKLDFAAFTVPVIEVLHQLGVPAEHTGRNDIVIQGRKFSGNAQYRFKNRLMHHGTILFASNLEDVSQALKPDASKTIAKGVASVRSRVTNISEHLPRPLSLEEFKNMLLERIRAHSNGFQRRELTGPEIEQVNALRNSRYTSWDWNYGHSPQFSQRRLARFSWGSMEAFLLVKRGIIEQCRFFGDFFTIADLSILEKALQGVPLREEALRGVLEALDPGTIIPGASVQQIMSLMID